MLRAQGKAVHQCDNGWVPVFVDQEQSISLMSVGFLLENPDEAVVWRGPKKHGKNLVRIPQPTVSAFLLRLLSLLSCLLRLDRAEARPDLLILESLCCIAMFLLLMHAHPSEYIHPCASEKLLTASVTVSASGRTV